MIQRSETLVGTNLNSVWLEGTVVGDPVGPAGTSLVKFQIQDHRPQDPEPPSIFDVEASGLAVGAHRFLLVRGQRVRVIGRLRQNHREACVVSERVETLGS